MIPVRMVQTRIHTANWESSIGLKRQVYPLASCRYPLSIAGDVLFVAMDQIVNQAAKIHYMFGGQVTVDSPRATKLYDRTKEQLTQDEVERI